MKTSDFTFHLPEALIAQLPLVERTQSRLLHVDRSLNQFNDLHFVDLIDLLSPNDLLILVPLTVSILV